MELSRNSDPEIFEYLVERTLMKDQTKTLNKVLIISGIVIVVLAAIFVTLASM